MSIGVIARLQVKPDQTENFERVFLHYQQQVRSNEPDNLFFHLHRSRTNVGEYIVMEQYADQSALNAHQAAQYYKSIPVTFGDFMSAAPQIETVDVV